MNDAAVVALSPETVLGEMKKNRVTHVVWLPDSETNWLTPLLAPGADRENRSFLRLSRHLR
jgi:hypothetical protein